MNAATLKQARIKREKMQKIEAEAKRKEACCIVFKETDVPELDETTMQKGREINRNLTKVMAEGDTFLKNGDYVDAKQRYKDGVGLARDLKALLQPTDPRSESPTIVGSQEDEDIFAESGNSQQNSVQDLTEGLELNLDIARESLSDKDSLFDTSKTPNPQDALNELHKAEDFLNKLKGPPEHANTTGNFLTEMQKEITELRERAEQMITRENFNNNFENRSDGESLFATVGSKNPDGIFTDKSITADSIIAAAKVQGAANMAKNAILNVMLEAKQNVTAATVADRAAGAAATVAAVDAAAAAAAAEKVKANAAAAKVKAEAASGAALIEINAKQATKDLITDAFKEAPKDLFESFSAKTVKTAMQIADTKPNSHEAQVIKAMKETSMLSETEGLKARQSLKQAIEQLHKSYTSNDATKTKAQFLKESIESLVRAKINIRLLVVAKNHARAEVAAAADAAAKVKAAAAAAKGNAAAAAAQQSTPDPLLAYANTMLLEESAAEAKVKAAAAAAKVKAAAAAAKENAAAGAAAAASGAAADTAARVHNVLSEPSSAATSNEKVLNEIDRLEREANSKFENFNYSEAADLYSEALDIFNLMRENAQVEQTINVDTLTDLNTRLVKKLGQANKMMDQRADFYNGLQLKITDNYVSAAADAAAAVAANAAAAASGATASAAAGARAMAVANAAAAVAAAAASGTAASAAAGAAAAAEGVLYRVNSALAAADAAAAAAAAAAAKVKAAAAAARAPAAAAPAAAAARAPVARTPAPGARVAATDQKVLQQVVLDLNVFERAHRALTWYIRNLDLDEKEKCIIWKNIKNPVEQFGKQVFFATHSGDAGKAYYLNKFKNKLLANVTSLLGTKLKESKKDSLSLLKNQLESGLRPKRGSYEERHKQLMEQSKNGNFMGRHEPSAPTRNNFGGGAMNFEI